MQNVTAVQTESAGTSAAITARIPALMAMAFGLVILYAVGFSPYSRAHNAAHDTRHANGFPCH